MHCPASGPDTDDAILGRMASGDTAAVGTLYDRYGGLALALAVRVLGDRMAAEEVVQDVFLQTWRAARSFDVHRGSVRVWLMISVHHRCIDWLRGQARPDRRALALDLIPPLADQADTFATVARRLDAGAVRRAIAILPPEQREVIVLAYFDGLSHTQVAECLRLPLGTVKGRLRLALEKLRASTLPSLVAAGAAERHA